jgi:hypothetical protein
MILVPVGSNRDQNSPPPLAVDPGLKSSLVLGSKLVLINEKDE